MIESASRTRSTILVAEATPNWLPELQREFSECDVRAVRFDEGSTNGAAELAIVVAESIGPHLESFLRWLEAIPRSTGVVVITTDREADTEWLLRERGVGCVLDASRPRIEVLRLCRYQLRLVTRQS